MSDEAVSEGRETRRPDPAAEGTPPSAPREDALEALRDIVFGSRLDAVDELRERVARAESLRALIERLEARAQTAEQTTAAALAARAAAARELAERLEAAEAHARRLETDAARALAEREAAEEGLARRADAAEALAERVEGTGGLVERLDTVEGLSERVEEVERLARGVEDIAQLDRRLDVVEEVGARVVDEDQRAKDVGAVLPRAVAARARQDGQLAASLRPTIESTLEASVRRNPQALVDIIFPVLGPAIRKMIGSAITSMVGTINRAVESSFTIRGLKWRVQAWRTKRSYAEIALMHGLVYRVEQLFLIHRESGLLLAHAVRDPADAEEPEAISGMLTAITDFVRDSFHVDSDSEVETFRVGDLTLIVKGGPQAVLAATVRGVPPPELHDRLSTTIEQAHREYGRAIRAFDGDTAALAGVDALLEPNLVEEQKERKKRGPASLIFWVLLSVVLATVVASFVTNRLRTARVANDVRTLARKLAAESGIVVTGTHEEDDGWVVEGLRDPLATDPATVLAASPLDDDDVTLRFGTYRSLELAFVQRRLASRLHVPQTVRASWRGRTLVLAGRTATGWAAQARAVVDTIAGIDGVDVSGLIADPTLDELYRSRAALLATVLSTDERVGPELIGRLRADLAKARTIAADRYAVALVLLALVRRAEDEATTRATATLLIERLEKAGVACTLRLRGPSELARPGPGEIVPEGSRPELRFDLDIRAVEDGPR